MDPAVLTAIVSIACALIAAAGGAFGAARSTNKQMIILGVQVEQFRTSLDETREELKNLSKLLSNLLGDLRGIESELRAHEHRLTTIEHRLDKIEEHGK